MFTHVLCCMWQAVRLCEPIHMHVIAGVCILGGRQY